VLALRTFGLLLILVGVLSGLIALFRTQLPFRLPLTGQEAAIAAAFLLAAGAVAMLDRGKDG